MAWDLNLCIDWSQQVLVPFHYFVEPRSKLFQTPPLQVFDFLRLPTDIQIIVYEHCELSTLFQLMRTCSRTRGPATKLFWNNTSETHCYHVRDDAPFSYDAGRHPNIEHCSEFARFVTKIEINFVRIELSFNTEAESTPPCDRKPASTEVKAQTFWSKVIRTFPAVRRVVLTGMLPQPSLPPPHGESDEAYTTIETVMEYAPLHIFVQVAFEGHLPRSPLHYTLWQVTKGLEPAWQVVDEDWTPTRILLPPRRFTGSPLGDLMTFNRRYSDLVLEMRGLKWLMVETYVRYALDGVIRCPRLDCAATFTESSQWKEHLWHTNHRHFEIRNASEEDHMDQLWCFKGTPDTERAAIEARQQRMDVSYKQTRKLRQQVKYGWNEEGSEQRRLFEEQLFAELKAESFTVPGELLVMDPNQLMCPWINQLYMNFDPTHVYYKGG